VLLLAPAAAFCTVVTVGLTSSASAILVPTAFLATFVAWVAFVVLDAAAFKAGCSGDWGLGCELRRQSIGDQAATVVDRHRRRVPVPRSDQVAVPANSLTATQICAERLTNVERRDSGGSTHPVLVAIPTR
jgi:hypothetical protein